ncbi:hypothetical protein FHT44_006113 [Mycolicibacterium sp. BK634]|uniref:hypothetical protein n=1 Tax=Mycolicibacterium sp. BK634 TaxID=2587099 RepID=UPI00161807EB|nr:hypothetical protein [Mycolicibacterium sp. BK634]MBB3753591.1 hypothetical protein [Mycolicibacterium sp. BK634]
MQDRTDASPPADHPLCSGPASAHRMATWALPLVVQPVLGIAIGLQRAWAAFGVTDPRDPIGPTLAAAAAAGLAVGVAILIRRYPAARMRALAMSLLAAAVTVPLSAVGLAVLLYE